MFKVKIMYLFLISMCILVYKVVIGGLEWCGLLMHYCDVLSAVWTVF